MKVKILSLLMFLTLCLGSFGQTRPRLVGGNPAGQLFPSVFLFSELRKNFTDYFCTASKISPTQFLTSAHCVLLSDSKGWYFPETAKPGRRYFYSFERDLSQPVTVFSATIKQVNIHPLLHRCLQKGKYFPAQCKPTGVPSPDIAVVTVEQEAGPFADAPALPLDFTPNKPGDDIIMLGYGLQGNGDILPPLLKYSFSKVATPEALSEVVKGTLAEHEGMPNEGLFFGTLGSLVDPSFPNLGSGDSGGPVLKDNPYRIVGVNSNAGCPEDAPSDCEKTTNSFFARIDSKATISVAEWLKSIVHH
ncbi:MAG: hypothetical protein EBQ85_09755 [Proteobacteria bacterium]|nr:hypothetical protein [Pseudomonadota bacterium]